MSRSRLLVATATVAAVLLLSGCSAAATARHGADASAGLTAAVMPVDPADATVSHPTPVPLAQDADGTVSVVTIGDSIMAGYGLDPASAWPVLLGEQDGVVVTNLGCSGPGFTVPGGCGTDYAGLIAKAVAAKPSLVIIQSSDNDQGAPIAEIDNATDATLRKLRTALPHTVIVGLSTLWDQPADPPNTIAASTKALRRAVGAVDGAFVNIGQPLAGQDGLLQADDEHPTVAGQQVMVGVVTQALRSVGITL